MTQNTPQKTAPLTTASPLVSFSLLATNRELLAFLHPALSMGVDEFPLVIDARGLSYRAVDPAHVSMASTTYDSRGMPFFWRTSDARFAIDAEKVKEAVMSLGKPLEQVAIAGAWNPANKTGTLQLRCGSTTRTIAVASAESMAEPSVPKLDHTAHAVVPLAELVKALRSASEVSDALTLEIRTDAFELKAEDTETTTHTLTTAEGVAIRATERATARFSVGLLRDFIKAIKSESVEISLSTDSPVRIAWTNHQGQGFFLLAPRIEQ